jgi:hypothetical protein
MQPGGRALFSAGLSNVLAASIQPSAQRLIAVQRPPQMPGTTRPAARSCHYSVYSRHGNP